MFQDSIEKFFYSLSLNCSILRDRDCKDKLSGKVERQADEAIDERLGDKLVARNADVGEPEEHGGDEQVGALRAVAIRRPLTDGDRQHERDDDRINNDGQAKLCAHASSHPEPQLSLPVLFVNKTQTNAQTNKQLTK